MCVDGKFDLEYNDINFKYKKGDTILIPAAVFSFILMEKLLF
jgi:mannose-6-phosphate isomerase